MCPEEVQAADEARKADAAELLSLKQQLLEKIARLEVEEDSYQASCQALDLGSSKRHLSSETGMGGVKTYRTLEGGGNSPRKLPLEDLDF